MLGFQLEEKGNDIFRDKEVLIISPHTDDMELWASGLVQKLLNNDCRVKHVCLSAAEESIPDGFPLDITRDEMVSSHEILGIQDYLILKYEVRNFPSQRQDILEKLIRIKEMYMNPDILITTSPGDIHQDHQVTGQESIRAFYDSTVITFVGRKGIEKFSPNFFVSLSDEELKKKCKAVECYKSQLIKAPYLDMVKNIMGFFGKLYGEKWIEPFKVEKLRWK